MPAGSFLPVQKLLPLRTTNPPEASSGSDLHYGKVWGDDTYAFVTTSAALRLRDPNAVLLPDAFASPPGTALYHLGKAHSFYIDFSCPRAGGLLDYADYRRRRRPRPDSSPRGLTVALPPPLQLALYLVSAGLRLVSVSRGCVSVFAGSPVPTCALAVWAACAGYSAAFGRALSLLTLSVFGVVAFVLAWLWLDPPSAGCYMCRACLYGRKCISVFLNTNTSYPVFFNTKPLARACVFLDTQVRVNLRALKNFLFGTVLLSFLTPSGAVCLSCAGNDPSCPGDDTCVLGLSLIHI